MTIAYRETAVNEYDVYEYPENIEELLESKYKNNIWRMQVDYPDMKIEFKKIYKFIDMDLEFVNMDKDK